MFYVMEWKIRTGYVGDAFKKFLDTGAPFPGVTMHGRYPVSYTHLTLPTNREV